jgi:hypothetical protein
MRAIDRLHQLTDDLRSGGIGELGQLSQVLIGGFARARALARRSNEDRALDWGFDTDKLFTDGMLLLGRRDVGGFGTSGR